MMTSTIKAKKIIRNAGVIVFWILLWQVLAYFVNKNLLIAIPTPISTIKAFITLSGENEFWVSALVSLLRVILGYVLAVVIATVFAYISSKSAFTRELFSPIIRLMRAVPVAAFIILVFLWVKDKNIPTLIALLTVLPVIWETTEKALSSVDKNLLEMAKVLGMKKGNTLKYIIFPSIKPSYISVLITGLGFAWKSGVAAEVICRTQISLGKLLWEGKNTIEYDRVFAVTAVIVIFSIIFEQLLKFLFRKEVAK